MSSHLRFFGSTSSSPASQTFPDSASLANPDTASVPPVVRRTAGTVAYVVAVLALLAPAPAARAGGPPAQIGRQTPTQSGRVRVRMVSQPWSATAKLKAPAVTGKRMQFIGHFPGYEAAKRAANARAAKLRQSTTRPQQTAAAGTGAAPTSVTPGLEAASGSQLVFEGPGETNMYPPDSQIAAGPNYVVVLINTVMAIYDKTGTQKGYTQSLSGFFSSLGVSGTLTDPRILYDQADGRFILSIAEIDFNNFTNGHVLLAVSQTSDPTGVWNKYAIDFKGRNLSNTSDTFPDFPGLGLSSSAVYITTNQFELSSTCLSNNNCSFSDAWIKVIGLPALLSGGSTLDITTFQNVKMASGEPAFDIQPALTYGTSANEYLVAASFVADPGTTLNLFAVNTSGTPALSNAPLTVPSYLTPPGAPQPGGQWIETNDFRTLNAVWVNGELWCGQNVQASTGESAARWYEIDLSDMATAKLVQSGDVSGAEAAYYPAMGAKADGTAEMSFSTSSALAYASAAYTGREPGDAAGTMRGYALYRIGDGPYDEQQVQRWGDYSGMSLDPDGTTFWGFAEYSGTPDPHFGTAAVQITWTPSLSVTPTSVSFGVVLVGRTSPTETLTFTNNGANPDTLGSIVLGGVNAADFPVSADQCSGMTLAAGASCTVNVAFAPTVADYEGGNITLGDENGMVFVPLQGLGVVEAVLTATPSPVQFPDTVEQTASAAIAVTLSNTGNEAADISGYSITGAFAESNTCPASLAAGDSCELDVSFYPTAVATFTGNLYINYNLGEQYWIMLNGTGITAPAAVPCPTAVNFGNQLENSASPPQTVILTNTGSAQLNLSTIAASGDFAVASNSCPTTMDPRASCAITLTFTPTTLGSESGTLTISDNAAGSPQTVALSGSGVSSVAAAEARQSVALLREQGALPAEGTSGGAAKRAKAEQAIRVARRPLEFEPNVGQFRTGLRFVARAAGYGLAVQRGGMLLELPGRRGAKKGKESEAGGAVKEAGPARVRIRLMGANRHAWARGIEKLPGKANYLLGRDPSRWRTNVATYARVKVASVYRKIDLVYYGSQRQLEYDFVVRRGGDPGRIRLAFDGVKDLRVAGDGDLELETAAGVVQLHKPEVYQARAGDGVRVNRRGGWVVEGKREAGFRLGSYDRSRALVIDPVLSFSTYLGGSGGEAGSGIAVDGQGNVYVAGTTYSPDFPATSSAYQTTCATAKNSCQTSYSAHLGYVAKLSGDGSTMVYATYLGGSYETENHAIAVDSSGDAYVTGYTFSPDFPVTAGAFQTQCQPSPGNSSSCSTPFVVKLDPTGSSLVYSTFLGGTPVSYSYDVQNNVGNAIAVDAAGDAFVGGFVLAENFPTTSGAPQPNDPMPGQWHGFVSELNPDGSSLVFSTYLGGAHHDQVNGMALDSSGNVYVTGSTQSANFPATPGAFQSGLYSDFSNSNQNAFVSEFSPTGTLLYSTFLGDTGWSSGAAIAVDASGSAYVTGTNSNNGKFPVTPGAFDTTLIDTEAFATKLHPAACALEYSTFLNSASQPVTTNGKAIAVDGAGDAYVGVETTNSGAGFYPSVNALQPDLGSGTYVTELNPSGSALLFSTALGGSRPGSIGGLALDGRGNVQIAGNTGALDFPLVNPLQTDCAPCNLAVPVGGPSRNAFVTKIAPQAATGITLTRDSLNFPPTPVGAPEPTGEQVGLTNNQAVALNIQSVAVSGTNYTLPTSTAPCSGSLAPGASCVVAVQFDPTATGSDPNTVTVTDDGPGSPRQITLNGTGLGDFSLWSPTTESTLLMGGDSTTFYVNTKLTGGAPSLSDSISLSCDGAGPATCAFSPASVTVGSSSTLTVGNLTALSGTTLNFTVNGTASGQTVTLPLVVALQDYSLSAASTTATVTAGQTASYDLTVTPINGMANAVVLSCQGLPSKASCTFDPQAQVNLNGTSPSTVTVKIQTTASSSGTAPPGDMPVTPGAPAAGWWVLGAALLLLGWLMAGRRRRVAPALAAIVLLGLCVSCGGGGGGGTTTPPPPTIIPGTPAGTYTVTVQAKYETLTRNVNLTLTVN
jgi:hypothetical protein